MYLDEFLLPSSSLQSVKLETTAAPRHEYCMNVTDTPSKNGIVCLCDTPMHADVEM